MKNQTGVCDFETCYFTRKEKIKGMRWQGWSYTCGIIFNELTGAAVNTSQVWKAYPSLKREKTRSSISKVWRFACKQQKPHTNCLNMAEAYFSLQSESTWFWAGTRTPVFTSDWGSSLLYQHYCLASNLEDVLPVAGGCWNVSHRTRIPGREGERTL